MNIENDFLFNKKNILILLLLQYKNYNWILKQQVFFCVCVFLWKKKKNEKPFTVVKG